LQLESDQHAIRDVHTSWVDATNAGDLARLLALMTDDVVFLNPGHEPLGRDGFPAGFLAAHQQFQLRCLSELNEVVVAGDVAYTRCRDSLLLTPRAGGEDRALAGHRLTVYRRQPDGRWLLARDVNTVLPAAK
jgi:uncharacterized protein (TIGR02246 family)